MLFRSKGVSVLYNPEFIAQGSIVNDLQRADIVLIGGEHQDVMDRYALLYNDIQTTAPNIHTMSLTAAEIVKIGTNCFLTTKISYANMLGQVLIRSGLEADVDRALTAIGSDSRIGSKYLRFGFGFGGPCFPRDNRSFGHYAGRLGLKFNIGATVDGFNREHAEFMRQYFKKANTEQLPFYMDSVTYKKNSDILEESQQLQLCRDLLEDGYTVYVEPSAMLPGSFVSDMTAQYKNLQFRSWNDLQAQGVKCYKVAI